jgi:hypothetical protein
MYLLSNLVSQVHVFGCNSAKFTKEIHVSVQQFFLWEYSGFVTGDLLPFLPNFL